VTVQSLNERRRTMKLRWWSFTLALALIGGLFAIPASGSDAQIGVEPSAPLQLAFLQLPDSQLSSPALPWAVLALGLDASAQDAQKRRPMCTQDSECTLHDYYCEGCNCLALPAGAKPPKCTGTIVQCFVAPCLNKHAACVNGECVVVANGTAASK
jgi:hypothetical protein